VTRGLRRRAPLVGALFVWSIVCSIGCLAQPVEVAQVLDGDSLRLHDGRMVRLIGLNAPEFGKDGRPDEPLAREARDLLAQLVAGKDVRLEHGPELQDRYRRTLAYVHLGDGTNVEQIMLREGMGFAIAIPPNLAHVDAYLRAESEARHAKRGVWAHPYYQPRNATRLGTADTGFRLVDGRVRRTGRSRDTIYLDLADNFTLAIPQAHWHHFGGAPQRFIGKRVLARGWVTARKRGLQLALSHPAMLEVVD
jgi:micrococcal nuclease